MHNQIKMPKKIYLLNHIYIYTYVQKKMIVFLESVKIYLEDLYIVMVEFFPSLFFFFYNKAPHLTLESAIPDKGNLFNLAFTDKIRLSRDCHMDD